MDAKRAAMACKECGATLPVRVARKARAVMEIGCTDWYLYPCPDAVAKELAAAPAARRAAMKRRIVPGPGAWVKRPGGAETGRMPAHLEASEG